MPTIEENLDMQESLRTPQISKTPKPIIHLDTYNLEAIRWNSWGQSGCNLGVNPAANKQKIDKGSSESIESDSIDIESELFYRNLSYNQLMDKYLSGII